ncbi:hypothetical protein AB0K80_28700 [Streptomyces sp. NPDC052682]|uniref:hypothetical protein n=1 Tax=Streptomyces sp. NPDC052682 TaxID=3154954 RepID=UPI00343E9BB5
MRRTARALSATVLAGAALGVLAPAASAEPSADVSPSAAAAGSRVTVAVSCDPAGGTPPATIDAASQAFEEGTVELKRAAGHTGAAAAPVYRGTATLAPAENLEGDPDAAGERSEWTVDGTCPADGGAEGTPWSAPLTVSRAGSPGSAQSLSTSTDWCAEADAAACEEGEEAEEDSHATEPCAEPDAASCEEAEEDFHATDPCAEPDAASCEEDSGSHPTSRPALPSSGPSHWCADPHATPCGGAAVQHGVRAGQGGAFTDSVPALVAGGLLIAGAAGAAAHRLRHRNTGGHG